MGVYGKIMLEEELTSFYALVLIFFNCVGVFMSGNFVFVKSEVN